MPSSIRVMAVLALGLSPLTSGCAAFAALGRSGVEVEVSAQLPLDAALEAEVDGGASSMTAASVEAEGRTTTAGGIDLDTPVATERQVARESQVNGTAEVAGSAQVEGGSAGGDAPRPEVARGLVSPGADRENVQAPVGVAPEARVEVEVEGVASLSGGSASLPMVPGGRVQVDGVRLTLDGLAPLAPSAPPADARMSTDRALDAWAAVRDAPNGAQDVVVEVAGGEARAPVAPGEARGAIRLHLVIDRSSSMQRSWSTVRRAAESLLGSLRPEDELQIVAYGTNAAQVYALAPLGDGEQARRALRSIGVGGGTDLEAGLRTAYGAAVSAEERRRTLVLLLSDGVPNRGAFEADILGGLAADAYRRRGVVTSTVGLGTDFDPDLLRSVAASGGGRYHVSFDLGGLAGGLRSEVEAHAQAAATEVEVRIDLAHSVQLSEVRTSEAGVDVDGSAITLRIPALDAGDRRRLVVRVEGGHPAFGVGQVALRYRSAMSDAPVEATARLGMEPNAAAEDRALDVELGHTLDQVGVAVENGDGDGAKAALDGYARAMPRMEGQYGVRVQTVRRLGVALEALVPSASHAERRELSIQLGERAALLLR